MNALTPIDQSDLVLTHIDTLILSPMNPRQTVTKEEIEALAESISTCGLIQNLSGYLPPGNEAIEIVAGGRRLRALRHLADIGFEPGPGCLLDLTRIPVKITRDQEVAAQWAMGENVARSQPNVADEVAAYAALSNRGVLVGDIARAFAVTAIRPARAQRRAFPIRAIAAAVAIALFTGWWTTAVFTAVNAITTASPSFTYGD